ncbi:hypothetical protein CDAR_615471 [Caerostris darwini]|uniref:Uncharacterized protein n=1 Tax=Caerostris darwini TaxID=1538125 RepID=A0AAV4RY15_9ARAC|nr:hypothetical protein CDAR_615471 [Caerostris darwini]
MQASRNALFASASRGVQMAQAVPNRKARFSLAQNLFFWRESFSWSAGLVCLKLSPISDLVDEQSEKCFIYGCVRCKLTVKESTDHDTTKFTDTTF